MRPAIIVVAQPDNVVDDIHGGHPASENPPVPGGDSARLKRFYNQELKFDSCDSYATNADAKAFANNTFQCARLEVPLDYEQPDGQTAQIALLRVPATGEPSKRIGSLLLNPGGPP
jgi:hypothetical protein